MATLISIAIIIVCVLLILIVLVQNSKGGGLASSFSSSNQVMGVRKTGDFLEKATWTLAVALLVLSIASAAFTKSPDANAAGKVESATRKQGANTEAPAGGSTTPAPAPGANKPAPTPVPAPGK
jgi:preprotein translocase subunit SecG